MSHTGQWVEIQIRTKRMDEIAEKGYAAHWKYKDSMKLNSQLDNWLDRIKEMIESPDADALSFIDDVKGYFFLDEISVFTPSGELRTLPAHSTVLDFAYAIHSEIGNTCIGAKVDKKLVPTTQELKNGEQIEIITSKKQTPRDEWLNSVVTTRAKTSIKMALKTERKKYFKQGKEKLEKLFAQADLDFSFENLRKFSTANSCSSLIDLYYAVATEKIGLKDVKFFAASSTKKGWMNFIEAASRKDSPELAEKNGKPNERKIDPLNLDIPTAFNFANPSFETASCCNPIPGDDIVGLYAAENLPIVIHRTMCPEAITQLSHFGNRAIKINWDKNESISFLAGIKITGLDKIGMINDISRIISSELSLNIKSFHLEAKDGLTEGEIKLFVQDTGSLYKLVGNLKKIDGVKNVTRVDPVLVKCSKSKKGRLDSDSLT